MTRHSNKPLPSDVRRDGAPAPFEFRDGTCDENVYRSVVEMNEYALPEKFERGDVIIDVGAHIGSFTRACMNRGAVRIWAFEPDPMNRAQFERNITQNAGTPFGVALFGIAVWRSDQNRSVLALSDYTVAGDEINTGSSSVVKEDGTPVAARSLDAVLDWVGSKPVRLLKLDCEYAEWPILFTSRKLDRVEEICGEYHEIRNGADIPEHARVDGVERFTIDELGLYLTQLGFKFHAKPHPDSNLGLFWARRG